MTCRDERNLWAGVLIQAIEDLLHAPDQYHPQYWVAQAYRWIISDDDSHMGTFCSVCKILGLDPDVVRTLVLATYRR